MFKTIEACFRARAIFVTGAAILVISGFACRAETGYSVETIAEYDAVFAREDGWTGGDAVYSVGLAKDVTLWLFGDTWVGPVVEGRHEGAKLVNNSVAIQRGEQPSKSGVKFYWGTGEQGKPEAFVKPADGVGWFWIFDGATADGKLYLFLMQIVKSDKKGVFGFKQVGTWLGVVENLRDDPSRWRIKQYKVPYGRYSDGGNTFLGSAIMKEGRYVYIYGASEDRSKGFGGRSAIVARVREEKMTDFPAWRFYGDGEWKANIGKADGLFGGTATEYSISYQAELKKYVAIYTENGLSRHVLMRTASAPVGPWSRPQKVFECPEAGWDKTYFCYAAKGHPEISGENELIVTYVCNSMDFWAMAKDARIYRPRFLRIKFDAGGE